MLHTPRTSRTRVIVAAPDSTHDVKQDVKSKRGVEHKFLSFRPPLTSPPSALCEATWQGILFRDSRAVGKLCSPSVSLTPILEDPTGSPSRASSTAVQQCSLAFDSWVPAGSSSGAAAQPLRIPVDPAFEQAELSVQVIGRQDATGASFALPHRYSVRGKELAAQLQLEVQRQSYVRRHQAARTSAAAAVATVTAQHPAGSTAAGAGTAAAVVAAAPQAGPAHPSTVTIESGDEVERLLSVFEVAEKPTWLKSLVCKFLVAETSAEAPAAASSGPAPHAVSPSEGTGSSSGGAAVAAATQRKQAGSKRRKAATRELQQPQPEQQEQAVTGEAASESSEGLLPEVASTCLSLPRQAARKPKKKNAAKPRAQAEQGACDTSTAAAMGEPLPEAAVAPTSSPSLASQQARGRTQQRRAAREPSEPWSPNTAGKVRKPQRRSSLGPPGVWAEPPALPPPPGLHLPPAPDTEQAQPRRSQSSEPLPRPSDVSQPAAALPVRLGRRASGWGQHRAPAAGGSSSDVSSEVATSGRPASSIAALSSRCTSPSLSLDTADLSPTPPVELLGAAATTASATLPTSRRGFALDSPEALRQLTEALLPHEASPSPAKDAGRQVDTSLSPAEAEREEEQEAEQELEQEEEQEAEREEEQEAEQEEEQETEQDDDLPRPIPLPAVPLPLTEGAAAEPALPARQLLNAAAPEFVTSAANSPRTANISEPSSPSSQGLPASDSQGYLSGIASSHGSTQTLGSQSGSQGWWPSADSSSGYSQHSHDHRHRLASRLYPGRTQSAPLSPQPWSPVGEGGSASGWSQQASRFGPGGVTGQPAAEMQVPGALHGHGRAGGMAGMAPGCWQQQLQQAEQWRVYSNPAAPPISMPVPALYGHGNGGPPLPNGTHPVLFQQRYQQQQHYLALQAQHGLLAALGQCSQPAGAAAAAALKDGWQHNPRFDPGYQQQQVWQQHQQLAGAGSLHCNGAAFARGHGRPEKEVDGEHSGGCAAAAYRQLQHQLEPRRQLGVQQWQYPVSAPASLAASPSVSQRMQGMQLPQQRGVSMEPLALQVVDSEEDGPDLERFLQAVTPMVAASIKDMAELTLGDVWQFYEVPSLFGQEVATLGGPRGPAASYYLPYLSAVQLFAPIEQEAAVADGSSWQGDSWRHRNHQLQHLHMRGDVVFSYPGGLEEWPAEMRLVYQWFAAGHVGERIPLMQQLEQLCGGAVGTHALMATRVSDLHPCSWFAVAWYPLYRIPEAPLDARFLTYHSLASLWELVHEARQAAALEAQGGVPGQQAATGCEGKPAEASAQAALPAACPTKARVPLSPFAAAAAGQLGPQSTTPTCVSSFPGSPTCSEAGTRTTNASARPAGSSLSSGDSSSQPRSEAESGGQSTAGGSTTPSPAASELGDVDTPTTAATLGTTGSSGSAGGGAHHRAHAAGGAGCDQGSPVKVPVVGLQWYTMPRSTENWLDTLVAAQLPEDVTPVAGTALADGSRICGCWRGVAVVVKPYPAAKGGPMAWEVAVQELEGTAQRLATGMGLHMRPPGSSHSVPAAVRCPDHDFFASRSWTCRAVIAAGVGWGRH